MTLRLDAQGQAAIAPIEAEEEGNQKRNAIFEMSRGEDFSFKYHQR